MSTRRWYLQRSGKALAVILGGTAGILGIALLTGDPKLDVSARPGTTWLSGETEGRVVLAAPFSDEASVAVALAEGESQFGVADTGSTIFVHDRAGSRLVALDGLNGSVKDEVDDPVFHAGSRHRDAVPDVVDLGDRHRRAGLRERRRGRQRDGGGGRE